MDVICPEFAVLCLIADGGEAPPEARAHADVCPRCRRVVGSLRMLDSLLAPETEDAPPPKLLSRLQRIPDLAPPRPKPQRWLPLAAAAVLLLAAGWWAALSPAGPAPHHPGSGSDSPRVVASRPDLRDRVTAALTDAAAGNPALLEDLDGARLVILNRIAVEDDPALARAALETLAASAPRESLPAALAAARMPDRTREAVRLLLVIGDPRALPVLEELYAGGECPAEVISALCAIGGEEAARILDRGLDALPASPLGETALLALARADGLVGTSLLLARYKEPGFSSLVLRATEEEAERLVPHLLDLAERGSGPAFALLHDAARPEAVPGLIRLLERRDTRGRAAMILARTDTARAARALIEYADHPEVEAAFRRAGPATETRLIALLETGQTARQRRAVELLALCGGPRAIRALLPFARNRALAPEILTTIGEIGGAPAVDALDLLAEIPRLERGAIRALGLTAAEEAVPILVRRGEENQALRGEAVAALGRIQCPAAVHGILELSPTRRPKSTTVRALRSMDRRVVVPALSSMLDGDRGPAARRALHALDGGPSAPRPIGNY